MATDVCVDGRTAVIRVTPAEALQELLNLSGIELATKQQKIFSITAMSQSKPTQEEYSSLKQREAQHVSPAHHDNPKGRENVAVTSKVEKKNPYKASEEFMRPVTSRYGESGGVSIPLKNVGLEEWKDTLKFLQTTDRKCHITISSDEITIFGSQQHQVAIRKLLQSTKISTNFTHKERIYYGEKGVDINGEKYEKEEETCPVCMDAFTKKTELKNCMHAFCKACLERSVKSLGPICPVCKDVFGLVEGVQPPGAMISRTTNLRLPGFHNCGTIEINYCIPSGTQTAKHPHPGTPYHGASRIAYLPDNKEGYEVLMLLKKAFDQKLIFTVGTSRTTGTDNMVTWNDISHKTSMHGGPQSFGYPDPHYLSRVKEELKAKGIK